jgi:signal recognition particle GTPase
VAKDECGVPFNLNLKGKQRRSNEVGHEVSCEGQISRGPGDEHDATTLPDAVETANSTHHHLASYTQEAMFENLSEKLQRSFKTLRGQGTISEENIADAMREIRLALLESDVNLAVVTDLVEHIRVRAMGTQVTSSARTSPSSAPPRSHLQSS